MIEMMNVSKKYGKGILAVNNLSVRIQDGEFVYVVGPSGAGKSTFVKILSGELEATEGEVIFDKNKRMSVLKQDHFQYEDEEGNLQSLLQRSHW